MKVVQTQLAPAWDGCALAPNSRQQRNKEWPCTTSELVAVRCGDSEVIWGLPKMVGLPNKPMGFPTKNDQHLGCEMGVPPFKETPIYGSNRILPSLKLTFSPLKIDGCFRCIFFWGPASFQGLR